MHGAFAQGRLLAQATPGSSAAVTLLQGNGRDAPVIEITLIVVANLTASGARLFSITHDPDGTDTSSSRALYWNASVPAGDSRIAFQSNHPSGGIFLGKNGTLSFTSVTASNLTCTVYGVTSNVQDRTLAGGNVR